jgi:DNA-binding NarL/FixJ family response regulator
MIRVAVVDDQPLLVSAFVALIDAQDDLTVVGTAGDGEQAVSLAASSLVDVMLMDLRMPVLDGVSATRAICSASDRPRILVLTTFNIDELVLGAVAAGARGFLLKDADPDDVLDGIRALHRGEAVISPDVTGHLVTALRDAPAPNPFGGILTAREREVLLLIAHGLTNREIAERLVIAETTVKTHVGNLLAKLDARDRVALVVLAHSTGIVPSHGPIDLDH